MSKGYTPSAFYFRILKYFLCLICFRYACLLDWRIKDFSVTGVIGYLSSLIWCPPQLAVFFGYFRTEERPDSRDILYLICCPSHLRRQVIKELQEKNVNFPTDADSKKKMIPGHDKAYVSLSGGIRLLDEEDTENFHLRWLHLCIIYIIG